MQIQNLYMSQKSEKCPNFGPYSGSQQNLRKLNSSLYKFILLKDMYLRSQNPLEGKLISQGVSFYSPSNTTRSYRDGLSV